MKRAVTVLLVLLVAVAGALVHTSRADATPSCTITQQFTTTDPFYSAGDWSVIVGPTMTAHCTSRWYVTFVPQCKTGHTNYAQCIDNVLCNVATACTPNQLGWGAGTTHSYDEPTSSPPGFTGYWDNGDGFNKSGTVCDYIWRIKEVFKNGNDNSVITNAFSPEGFCI